MKRVETITETGRAILIAVLVFGVDLRAQDLSVRRPMTTVATVTTTVSASAGTAAGALVPFQAPSRHLGSDRFAEAEWTRGHRDGYELGFWTGVQDARAFLPPTTRPPGFDVRIRTTPYRQGYLAGYDKGYRQAFLYPWHLHAW